MLSLPKWNGCGSRSNRFIRSTLTSQNFLRNAARRPFLDSPIPAHLLGNMWAQQWGNIIPTQTGGRWDRGYDLTQILKSRNTDPKQLVHYGESLRPLDDPLPSAFKGGPIQNRWIAKWSVMPVPGRRLRKRCATENVYPNQRGGFTTVPRTGTFYQMAYAASLSFIATVPAMVSLGYRRHDSLISDATSHTEDRTKTGAGPERGHWVSAAACAR